MSRETRQVTAWACPFVQGVAPQKSGSATPEAVGLMDVFLGPTEANFDNDRQPSLLEAKDPRVLCVLHLRTRLDPALPYEEPLGSQAIGV